MGDPGLSQGKTHRRLTTVVAADICGYSRIAEANEAVAIKTVEAVYSIYAQIVQSRRGRIFHRAGDGFLAEFPSAADAVLASIEFVDEIKKRNTLAPNNLPVKVRVGVHSGDVTDQGDGNLLGHGVNVAARLQAEAAHSGILVSLHTVNLVRGKIDVRFRRRGPLALKNITEPVIAFDITAGGQGAHQALTAIWRRIEARPSVLFAIFVLAILVILIRPMDKTKASDGPAAQINMALDRSGAIGEIDRRRFRAVAEDLLRSGEVEDRNVFDLLLQGDLYAAYQVLWERFEVTKDTQDKKILVGMLHQAGAIIMDADVEKAKMTFEKVLDIDADDFVAHERLGELYYHQSASTESNYHFERALEIATDRRWKNVSNKTGEISWPTDEEVLFAKINYATSLNVQQRYDPASKLLEESIFEARRLGYDSLVSRVSTRIAHAQVKNHNFDAARKTLSNIMPLQERRNFDADRAISYGLLGMMSYEQKDFANSGRYFKRSLSLERSTGRALGISDMLFYVGMTELEKGNYKAAGEAFDEGLDIARENNLRNMIIKNMIGKSLMQQLQGDQMGACGTLARAARFNTEEIIYIPMTIEIISRIDCPYPPFSQ